MEGNPTTLELRSQNHFEQRAGTWIIWEVAWVELAESVDVVERAWIERTVNWSDENHTWADKR